MEVTYALGAEMLVLAGCARVDHDARAAQMEKAIGTGTRRRAFPEIIEAQGGNPAVVDDPAVLPQAAECELFAAPRRGFIARVEPRASAAVLSRSAEDGRRWRIVSILALAS